ncbi:dihydrolipoamide acetyltransferase family protein [Pseudalkalibacillus caeni]|uniref:Dihydrolipoamide acetyltransferase component of pyruvate dehydrogenase complex n=1 Tax=Exobacillus caeni TaxID=2574798 RepID=A0A5R9F5Y2_9BACL|nr:dihydrolipoamide acetyltransferase family protein [Pseudalkalibacillus caeni]TLS36233.1 2-oxo acid dehydrogenase subunit E2 [Pseudalkalibacillus caeni]
MSVQIIMPKLGMSMEEGTVVEWLKKKGDPVKKGETVAVISSEKIEKDIEAPGEGFLIEISAEQDDVVAVGKPIGYIGQQDEKVSKEDTQKAEPQGQEEVAAAVEAPVKEEEPKTKQFKVNKPRLSPAARKLAKAEGVEVESLVGTGPNGRVTRADVERAIQEQKASNTSQPAKQQAAAPPPPEKKPERKEQKGNSRKVSGMRKVIAERMYNSLQQTAQLTITMKADVTELMAIQKKAKADLEGEGVKLTITDFIARATVLALQKHPQMNSTYENEEITTYENVHLGIAVALENGLVVPVITNADTLSTGQISQQIRTISQKAREGKLAQEDMKGSTFTITSLGAFGVDFFTPVLNPPEAGILGIGRAEATPVFVGENVEKRYILPLSLTFDHRVLDGAPASEFLGEVKSYLEKPYRLFV